METTMEKRKSVEQAYALFSEFREAYAGEWERLDNCERMYHGDHWYGVPERDKNEPRPVTPVIQSTIESVRADLMDQCPEAVITADDPKHDGVAELLTQVVKENHTRFNYNAEYAKLTHDLLVGATWCRRWAMTRCSTRAWAACSYAMWMRAT